MKEVVLCEHAGFCFGAARAVETLEKELDSKEPIYTFGPILNNARLVKDFSLKGVRVIENIEDFKDLKKGKIIIRSHGVSKEIYEGLESTGFEIIDATCPFVKRIHEIVSKRSEMGERIVVIGNPEHPEVKGIVGWSKTGAVVLETKEDVLKFVKNKPENLCIVSQTTFNRIKFQEFLDIFEKNSYNTYVSNTICDATRIRQSESEELSRRASVFIVIGDPKSSNSRKLYDICKANCSQTFFIQTVDDIKGKIPEECGLIGITAGASTPKYIIEEVQNYVKYGF